MDPVPVAILALVTAERAGELLWSRANAARLVATGGHEVGANHYPFMVAVHAAWLVGLWALGWNRPVEPIFVAIFLLSQVGRGWVLWTLGQRWTTRIFVVPGEKPVTDGPYRLMRHPNYLVVAIEIAALPLAFGLVAFAVIFSVLNAVVLAVRIRSETAAWEPVRQP